MWKNSLFATAVLMVAVFYAIASAADFLVPYKRVLFHRHGHEMLIYGALLTANVFSACAFISRKLLLKDTGRKLPLLDKQFRESIPELMDQEH
jgi:hypothetical protein